MMITKNELRLATAMILCLLGISFAAAYVKGSLSGVIYRPLQDRTDDLLVDLSEFNFPKQTLDISRKFPLSPVSDAANQSRAAMKYGINYISTHWHYEPNYLSNDEIERDFALFRSHDLKYVSLVAIWKYLEPEFGAYNYEALDDIRRVCGYALEYNLQVMIDFHTMMKNDSWTMPEWLSPRRFETVLKNNTARQAWLDFLGNCTAYLDSMGNIHSWHMMNEPAIGEWACNVTVDEFIELWSEMRNVIKAQSTRQVSIRFGARTLNDHFGLDPRIFDLCDYISLNWYEEHCSVELFEEVMANASAYKTVLVSEFGYSAADDQLQSDKFSGYLQLFKETGVADCMSFYWRADYEFGDPPPPGTGYNLAKNLQGEPRPAIFLMDSVPPNISNVSQSPSADNVKSEDEVRVNASVTDASSGVKSVILNYTVNGTVRNPINLTSIEQDSWNCTIPYFPYGTNVSYMIVAEDKAGNAATSEETSHVYGYEVVPEFHSASIIVFFLGATLLASMLLREKSRRSPVCAGHF